MFHHASLMYLDLKWIIHMLSHEHYRSALLLAAFTQIYGGQQYVGENDATQ